MRNHFLMAVAAGAVLLTANAALARDEADDLIKSGLEQLEANPQAAAEALAKAAALRPNDARTAYNLGVALAGAGKEREAAEAFQRADVLSTDASLRADARYNQGVLELNKALPKPDGAAGAKEPSAEEKLAALSRAERQFRRSLDAGGTQAPSATEAAKWVERLQRKRQQIREEQQKQRQQQQQEQNQQQDPNQQQQEGQDQQDQQQGGQQQQQQSGGGGQQQQQQQGQQQGADAAQQLQDLAQQQQQLSQGSQQATGKQQTPQQREERQRQQAELSQQTEQAAQQQAERQAQKGDGKPDPTQEKLDKARDEQAKAQEAMAKGDDKAAAEAQKKAAQQLMEAAQEAAKQQGEQGQDQPPQDDSEQSQSQAGGTGDAQGRSSWDFTAAEILDKERRERDILRRVRRDNRRAFVERDW